MKNRRKIKLIILGVAEILTLVFIVLKLTNVINFSWLWVLSPLWLPFITLVTVMSIFYLVLIVCLYFKI